MLNPTIWRLSPIPTLCVFCWLGVPEYNERGWKGMPEESSGKLKKSETRVPRFLLLIQPSLFSLNAIRHTQSWDGVLCCCCSMAVSRHNLKRRVPVHTHILDELLSFHLQLFACSSLLFACSCQISHSQVSNPPVLP